MVSGRASKGWRKGKQHTSSDGIAVDIPSLQVVLPPECGKDGAKERSVGEHGGRDNPRQGDGTPVGEPPAELVTGANQVVMAEHDLEHGDDAHDDGEDAALKRDGDAGVGNGLGDGGPGGHGGNQEGALHASGLLLRGDILVDARIGRGEEHKQAGAEPDGNKGADGLGNPLLDGGGTDEEAGPEVTDERGSHVSATRSKRTGNKVDLLRMLDSVAAVRSGTTEDELRGLGGGGERGVVGNGADLNGEE